MAALLAPGAIDEEEFLFPHAKARNSTGRGGDEIETDAFVFIV
jgi:hypothetical protein